jgi:hypothetical protein
MKVGLAPIYSPRPIPHFMTFLGDILSKEGHEVHVLTCDGAFPTCMNHLFRSLPRVVDCLMCRAGGMRSFPLANYTGIDPHVPALLPREEAKALAFSSAITLSREETEEGFRGPLVRGYQDQLAAAVAMAHADTVKWAEKNTLDAVFFYNGRMDVTAGVLAACQQLGVPAISVERSLVGHGIWLIPNESCLSQREFDRLMGIYANVPLTSRQAELAACFLARRQLRTSRLEWRVYNPNASEQAWPGRGPGRKILILPSSRNELEGNAEWTCAYTDATASLPRLFRELRIEPAQVVIRGHPLWASKVGSKSSSPAQEVWKEFSVRHGCHYFDSSATASSQHLMAQADLVVLNGSSAALEAGALGKSMICFGHAQYQNAGLALHIQRDEDWQRLGEFDRRDAADIIRATLRFAYCVGWRFPQYVEHVRGVTPTQYVFLGGGSIAPLLELIGSGRVPANDPSGADDTTAEDAAIALCRQGRWTELSRPDPIVSKSKTVVRRRFLFRAVDALRNLLPKGDA